MNSDFVLAFENMVIGLKWTRPLEIVPYPNIWHEFEAKESRNSEKLVKYRIQDLPEDRFDDAIKHMIDHYLVDEPLSNSVGRILVFLLFLLYLP